MATQKLLDLTAFSGQITHAAVMQRALFTPSQATRLLGYPPPEAIVGAYRLPPEVMVDRTPAIRQLSMIECGHYMRNTLLRDADVMSMAHALELRVPLLDHSLVETVLNLEDKWKLHPKMPKPLLVGGVKAATGSALPEPVVYRPKRGFTFPFAVWLRGALGKHVRQTLTSSDSPLNEVLDPEAVASVWHDFDEARASWSRPWSLYVLDRWINRNLGVSPVTGR
jgi:asparagine synthase (glutamine-hydrolysing)